MSNDRIDKILIVRFSSLGDVALLLPSLVNLRNALKEARIHFLTKKLYSELLFEAPFIDRLFTVEKGDFSEIIGLKRELGKEHYDIVVDAHGIPRSIILCSMVKAKKKISINKDEIKKFLLISTKINLYRRIVSQKERYDRIFRSLGIDFVSSENATLPLAPKIRAKAAKIIEGRFGGQTRIIAFAPGARWETKRWPTENFSHLVEHTMRKGYAAVLIGGAEDSILCNLIAQSVSGELLDLSGKLSILESAAVLERCSVLVTNDSAPLHLAETVGTPVLAFFGPTVREFGYFPRLPESIALEKKLHCRPCSRNGARNCPYGTKECLAGINVSQAMDALMRILDTKDKET